MSAPSSPKLTRLVRGICKAVIHRYDGQFQTDEYEAAVDAELAKENLNHPDFRRDIARTFVKADIAERAKIDPFVTDDNGHVEPSLFKSGDFSKGVIRLGDHTNIRMLDATSQHWIRRQLHQQRAAEDAQRAATRTTEFLQTPPGEMLVANPRMTTSEAMRQLSLWPETLDDDEQDEPEA